MVRLTFHNVGARYRNITRLSQVTAGPFEGGEVVAVIGPNAAGKSTLFRRIADLLEGPGKVEITGARSRRAVGLMTQETGSNGVLTVFEAVLLALRQGGGWRVPQSDLAAVEDILGELGIADLAARNLGTLSGGQRQMVSLAQTLVRSPDIVLMDEPTSALDLRRQVEVLDFMRRRARERGTLVLAALHDLNQVLRVADKVIVIRDGRLLAQGRCLDVLTPTLISDVYEVFARIEECSQGFPRLIIDGAL